MQLRLALLGLVLAILTSIGTSFRCPNITRKVVIDRCVCEEGEAKKVLLHWGSDPGRAAAALLATVLRDKLGYENVTLYQGPHNLHDLAAGVPFTKGRKKEVIIALSTAWIPEKAPEWRPLSGATSGLAGPRLEEFGASGIPARQRLYVYLADKFRQLAQCKNVIRWSFYTNATALEYCGFLNSFSGNENNAIVYGLNSSYSIKEELNTRAKASQQLLQFKTVDRKSLFQNLRNGNHSFLFVDYDMWVGYFNVSTVQPPPCIAKTASICQQELDTAIAMRVADVFLLQEYAPELFQVVHNFAPSLEAVGQILELESNGNDIEEAACEWASKHDTIVDTWLKKYDPSNQEYNLMIFHCNDDPDYKAIDKLIDSVINLKIYEIYKSTFKIRIRKYPTNCSDVNYIKNEIKYFLSYGSRQRLIGAVVGGVKNITDIVKAVNGTKLPMLLYDAVGVEADSSTSTWLTSGRSLHLALAIDHFIRSMKWTRVAVLSERTPTAERLSYDLKNVMQGDIAIGEHNINVDLSLAEAKTVLQTLKDEKARIIIVNANYKDAATILAAGTQLNMNSSKDYAWIVRDWRPNNSTSNIMHFTISFSCWSNNSVGRPDFLNEMEKLWPQHEGRYKKLWPAQGTALADAVLAIVDGFNNVFLKYPQARDDIHSARIIREFGRSLIDSPLQGVTQTLKFKGHSLEEAVVFFDKWQGDQYTHLARWRVNATKMRFSAVTVDYRKPALFLMGTAPHDGSSGCKVYSGDPYLPTCYDWLWAAGLVFLILIPPAIALLYCFVCKWLKKRKQRIIQELLARRHQCVATISPGYLVNRSALELQDTLGTGRFGYVHLALLRVPGRKPRYVAAKELRDPQEENEILHEASTLASLDHKHIIRLVGVCIDEESPLVLMEVAFFGDLLHYLQARRYFAERATFELAELDSGGEEADHVSPKALTRMAREAASALEYLTLRGIIHRDLRASNCLVDANRSLKVADFGMARETKGVHGDTEYACRRNALFPVLWMPPESLEYGVFSTASDVWALGVLVFELVTFGARPYGDMKPPRVMQFVVTGGKPPMPRDAAPQTISLVRQCWQRDPE